MRRNAALLVQTLALTASTLAFAPGAAAALAAESYPAKPIRMVITFPAGGPTDVVVRLIGQRVNDLHGTPVIADNRGGAGGIVGTEIVARAAPDGYTFLVGTAGGMTINPNLHSKLPYDPFRDFTPVAMLVLSPQILVTHPALGTRTLADFISAARGKPGGLLFASAGAGTATHLGLELLKVTAGIQLTHVPYKGGAPALTDVIGGQVHAMWTSIPSVLQHVQAGRVRAVAVSTAKRSASAPEVPTVAESGFPGFEYANWNALFAPANTPAQRVKRMNAIIAGILSEPTVAQKLVAQGAEPAPGSSDELARYMRADDARWKKVIRTAGLRPE